MQRRSYPYVVFSILGFLILIVAFSPTLSATVTKLHDFNAVPTGALIRVGGALYGMTTAADAGSYGTVFRMQPNGTGYTVLHRFVGGAADGETPVGSLVEVGGALYGVTNSAGTPQNAVIFRLNPDGTGFTILHRFGVQDGNGYSPSGGLTVLNGVLYGMTRLALNGEGTIYKINPDGSGFSVLHLFTTPAQEGKCPVDSLLALGGALYGVAQLGGHDFGTLFTINADGSGFTVLHSFWGTDGEQPIGPPLEVGGVIYGVTNMGGNFPQDHGVLYKINPDGSGFSVLRRFGDTHTDGGNPAAALTAVTGAIYGTTYAGGVEHTGTVFKINPDGSGFSLLHSFTSATGGYRPGALLLSGGTLYGITTKGGTADRGIVYTLPLHAVHFQAGSGGTLSGVVDQLVGDGGSGTPVTAVANPGYRFVNWSGGVTGTANPIAAENVTSALTITANFVPGGIVLLTPNGGENWQKGSVQNITWQSAGGSGPLTLELWCNGAKLGNIAENLPISPAAYAWTVGDYIGGSAAAGSGYTVRIVGSGCEDVGDASFAIWAPGVTLTVPNGGENWVRHESRAIQWSSQGLSGNVKLELMSGGTSLGVVAQNIPIDAGTYTWDVGCVNGAFPAAGNYTVRVSTMDNAYSDSGDAPFALLNRTPILPAASDFNGDGRTDLFWRYYGSGGFNCVWLMGLASAKAPAPARSVASVEMNGMPAPNGRAVEVMESGAPRQAPAVMGNAPFTAAVDEGMAADTLNTEPPVTDPRTLSYARNLPATALAAWRMGGVADFDGDGQADILWRNHSDGRNVVWFMNGLVIRSVTQLQAVANLGWEIGGVADFNADGFVDILWRNYTDGRNVIWLMDRFTIKQVSWLPGETDPNWRITGVCDITSDGHPDIFWRNVGDGRNLIWCMNRVSQASVSSLPTVASPSWEMAAFGDFTGDGETDIVWRHTGDGRVVVWKMDRFALIGTVQLPAVTTADWKIENN